MTSPGSVPAFMSHSDSASITPMANLFQTSNTPPSVFSTTSPAVPQSHTGLVYGLKEELRSPQNIASGRRSDTSKHGELSSEPRTWPKLPGFAPPVGLSRERS